MSLSLGDSSRGSVVATRLARLAVELDVLLLDVERAPEAVADDLTYVVSLHHASGAISALNAMSFAPEIRVAHLQVAA